MICEACGKNEPWALSFDFENGWRLCCGCRSGKEIYYIEFSLCPVGWLEHMREKRWFVESDFLAAVGRIDVQ
jgi:hypothetical protein